MEGPYYFDDRHYFVNRLMVGTCIEEAKAWEHRRLASLQEVEHEKRPRIGGKSVLERTVEIVSPGPVLHDETQRAHSPILSRDM